MWSFRTSVPPGASSAVRTSPPRRAAAASRSQPAGWPASGRENCAEYYPIMSDADTTPTDTDVESFEPVNVFEDSEDMDLRPGADNCYKCSTCDSACRSEEHTSELQSRFDLVCRLLLEIKKNGASQTR